MILCKGRYYPVFEPLNAIELMSAIENLLQVMVDLRDPENGCPWDIRQTSQTIAGHTLDETHELVDAIERDDTENIKEELGDLLFNIVFHSRVAEEKGQFDFADVAQDITDKMLRRHPHVFGEGVIKTGAKKSWRSNGRLSRKKEKAAKASKLG